MNQSFFIQLAIQEGCEFSKNDPQSEIRKHPRQTKMKMAKCGKNELKRGGQKLAGYKRGLLL